MSFLRWSIGNEPFVDLTNGSTLSYSRHDQGVETCLSLTADAVSSFFASHAAVVSGPLSSRTAVPLPSDAHSYLFLPLNGMPLKRKLPESSRISVTFLTISDRIILVYAGCTLRRATTTGSLFFSPTTFTQCPELTRQEFDFVVDCRGID